MTKGVRFGEGCNIFSVLEPADIGGTATPTDDVDLLDANWVTFVVQLGNMTSDATDTVTVIVYSSTAVDSTDASCAYWYRLSGGAVGADNSWGVITAGSSDGTAIAAATQDKYTILIDVDPAVAQAAKAGARWVHLNIDPVGPVTLASCLAIVEHKYPGNSMSSS